MTKATRRLAAAFCALGAAAGADALLASAAAQTCMMGEVRMFNGNFAPAGWAFTDGQLLAVSQNDALFSILGTIYGGDGRTTFALPDLRGRAVVSAGSGPGLNNWILGQKGGQQTTSLTAATVPAHNHTATTTTQMRASSAVSNSSTPVGNSLADEQGENIYNAGPADVNMAAGAVVSSTTLASAGGGIPYDQEQPSLATNYIICIYGTYPTRN